MTPTSTQHTFPRLPLLAIGTLVVVTLVTVGGLRISGYRPTSEFAAAQTVRALRFADRNDGGISVIDAATGTTIDVVAPGTNGFLRATVRGLATERKHEGSGPEQPFLLSRRVDGTVVLQDPATGRSLDLNAFGPTNSGAFARFLPGAEPRSTTASL